MPRTGSDERRAQTNVEPSAFYSFYSSRRAEYARAQRNSCRSRVSSSTSRL